MRKQILSTALSLVTGIVLSQSVVFSNLTNPKGLVVKEDNAYFFENGAIKKIDLTNPVSSTTVFSGFSAQAIPSTLEPSTNGFFYPETGQTKVWKVGTSGATESLTNNFIAGTGGHIGFAFSNDVGDTFFTRELAGSNTATELRIRLGNSYSSQVIKNIPNSYLNILDVATFGNIFYFSTNNGRVWRVGRYNNIATQELINIGQNNIISGVEVTQDYLYYIDRTNDKVVRVLRSDGTGAVDLFSGLGITSIDIKNNVVYGISSSNLYKYTDPNISVPCTNIVNIPDANFKAALLAHGTTITDTGISVIDTDGDGEICESEAQAYTGKIFVTYRAISNLTGIEAFTGLTELECDENQLTSINVSANTALTKLSCNLNQITSLDVSNNLQLTQLACGGNQLTSLDVSSNTALIGLFCASNQITSLDVSGNMNLVQLGCVDNSLSILNVANGNNTNMTSMYANANTNLTCIQTDAGIVGTNPNGWFKDATASYNTSCPTLSTVDIDREEASIMIYPNPASAMVHVEWKEQGIEQVDILDASGRKVLSQQVTGKKATIAVDRLATGIYFVKTGNTTQKLIVE